MKKKRKRVTNREMMGLIQKIVNHNKSMSLRIGDLDWIIGEYIDFKKDRDEFAEHLDGKYKQPDSVKSGGDSDISEE